MPGHTQMVACAVCSMNVSSVRYISWSCPYVCLCVRACACAHVPFRRKLCSTSKQHLPRVERQDHGCACVCSMARVNTSARQPQPQLHHWWLMNHTFRTTAPHNSALNLRELAWANSSRITSQWVRHLTLCSWDFGSGVPPAPNFRATGSFQEVSRCASLSALWVERWLSACTVCIERWYSEETPDLRQSDKIYLKNTCAERPLPPTDKWIFNKLCFRSHLLHVSCQNYVAVRACCGRDDCGQDDEDGHGNSSLVSRAHLYTNPANL